MKKKRKHSQTAHSAVLGNEVLVKLLEIDAKHNALVASLEQHGIELDVLKIDLHEIVLDALGVPADNTVEQTEKYGTQAYERHDTVCRDLFNDKWFGMSADADRKAIQEYLLWILEQLETHPQ